MKRKITITIAALTLILMFTLGVLAKRKHAPKPANEVIAAQAAQRAAPMEMTITDKSGKPIKLESLSSADRAQVERLRGTMEKFRDGSGSGGAQRTKIDIRIHCCPLEGEIIVKF